MAKVLRPIGHEDRLSIVDHLDELRSRLIICGIALAIAFARLLLAEPRPAEGPQPGPAGDAEDEREPHLRADRRSGQREPRTSTQLAVDLPQLAALADAVGA